jgi:hypothetical protein
MLHLLTSCPFATEGEKKRALVQRNDIRGKALVADGEFTNDVGFGHG